MCALTGLVRCRVHYRLMCTRCGSAGCIKFGESDESLNHYQPCKDTASWGMIMVVIQFSSLVTVSVCQQQRTWNSHTLIKCATQSRIYCKETVKQNWIKMISLDSFPVERVSSKHTFFAVNIQNFASVCSGPPSWRRGTHLSALLRLKVELSVICFVHRRIHALSTTERKFIFLLKVLIRKYLDSSSGKKCPKIWTVWTRTIIMQNIKLKTPIIQLNSVLHYWHAT